MAFRDKPRGKGFKLQRNDRKVMVPGLTNPAKAAKASFSTLDARFTILNELKQQTAVRQSQGREALLAKKRGMPAPQSKPQSQQQRGEGKGRRRGGKPGTSQAPKRRGYRRSAYEGVGIHVPPTGGVIGAAPMMAEA
ncbi:hypothetical protein WJX72_001197 [[Myrmecia] bisecta]|uniref:Uncharacterized protein n=1 Tax=[Myrmecia] bisecta TaxID=41462 RepID=A0AAW1P1Q2_9CHLO